MGVYARPVLVALACALVVAQDAAALECPQATLRSRIDAADAVFVGTLVEERRAVGGERFYRFDVAQVVKGPVGSEIEVRAPILVDADDRPIGSGVDAGVLAQLEGPTFTTDSCGLTDPGALLAEADEPRGGVIKLVVGTFVLAAALAYAALRLRRRRGADSSSSRGDRRVT